MDLTDVNVKTSYLYSFLSLYHRIPSLKKILMGLIIFYIQMSPVDGEDDEFLKQSCVCLRSQSSEEDLVDKVRIIEENVNQEKIQSAVAEPAPVSAMPKSWRSASLGKNLTNITIPRRGEFLKSLGNGNGSAESVEPDIGGCESEEEDESAIEEDHMLPLGKNLAEEEEERELKAIPRESILKRINSRKGMKSYQLGKQLSHKWTTGAGARISCVRDYPSKLQLRALEHLELSPRRPGHCRSESSPCQLLAFKPPRASTPTSCRGSQPPAGSPFQHHHTTIHHPTRTSSPLSRSSNKSTTSRDNFFSNLGR